MGPGDAVYDYISTLEYLDGSKFSEGEDVTVVAASRLFKFLNIKLLNSSSKILERRIRYCYKRKRSKSKRNTSRCIF